MKKFAIGVCTAVSQKQKKTKIAVKIARETGKTDEYTESIKSKHR